MNEQNKNDAPKLIEMPEHLRVASEATTRELGDSAAGGLYGNGVITIDKGPGIPVENPGPQAIRRAGVETMIDGKVGYVLPGQSVEPRDSE